jgi:hypothetical protein
VLDTYLHASLGDARLSSPELREIIDDLGEPTRIQARLGELNPDQVRDLVERIGDHVDRLPGRNPAGAALTVLRLRDRLGESLGIGIPQDYKLMQAVQAVLSTVSPEHRAREIASVVRDADTLSTAFLVLRHYGTSGPAPEDQNPDAIGLSVEQTKALEEELLARIRRDPVSLVDESDFGEIVGLWVRRDVATLEAVREAAWNDSPLFLRLVEACVLHIRSSAPPHDRYELQVPNLEEVLGPASAVASALEQQVPAIPSPRLSAALAQLRDTSAD